MSQGTGYRPQFQHKNRPAKVPAAAAGGNGDLPGSAVEMAIRATGFSARRVRVKRGPLKGRGGTIRL
jgi:hypothetical protein